MRKPIHAKPEAIAKAMAQGKIPANLGNQTEILKAVYSDGQAEKLAQLKEVISKLQKKFEYTDFGGAIGVYVLSFEEYNTTEKEIRSEIEKAMIQAYNLGLRHGILGE